MPKYAVTKAMKVLLETTNNNSESQLVWWCCGHDCVARSQGNPSVPLLSGSTLRPVDGNMVQLQAVLAFLWILPMNSQPPFYLLKFLYWATRMLLRAKRATADLFCIKINILVSSIDIIIALVLAIIVY